MQDVLKIVLACDKIMTEVDLALWQWQADVDMLVFAGIDVSLVLHKDGDPIGVGEARLIHDDGALTMTCEKIKKPSEGFIQAWRVMELKKTRNVLGVGFDRQETVPLVMYKGGVRIVIGSADFTVMRNGNIMASCEVTEDIPELTEGVIGDSSIDYNNHPFFRDDAMNRRCTKCERLVRRCLCENKEI